MAVAKINEVIGTSSVSWEDAAERAIKRASRTLVGLKGIEVTSFDLDVKGGKIREYRVRMRLIFELVNDLPMHI